MTTKIPPTEESQDLRKEQEVVLRDESDEIIDNLKGQLHALQTQLEQYKSLREDRPQPPGGSTGREVRAQAGQKGEAAADPDTGSLEIGLTPHIAKRLRIPAEELAVRLGRLIEQIADPELKVELEHCRDTASFLFDTFQRISDRHQELTDSLSANALVMDSEEFRSRLEASLHERELKVQVAPDAPLPRRLALAPQSAITVLTTLANLAHDIFGRTDSISLGCPGADAIAEGEPALIRLCIASKKTWQGQERQRPNRQESGQQESGQQESEPQGEVSMVVIRSGVRTHAVVDLLYVEKIIEMQGGVLEFLRREGRICGFEVTIPITLLEKGGQVESGATV